MFHPAVNPRILLSPVEDGYVAYDPDTDQLHHLNPLAALISELCDGIRSVKQIHELVAPILPAGQSEEIERWIDEGIKAGLLQPELDSLLARSEFSADELAKLAKRLRENGKVRTAFLCQKRAAEIAVHDAKKWVYLGDLAHIIGRREDARAAYEKYLELRPGDAEVKHLLVALRDEPPPSRVPNECIQQLYQRFSSFYESNVCDELGYRGPEQIAEMFEPVIAGRDGLVVLDLGCGSGLAGVRFKPWSSYMVGIDLSAEMVGLARKRDLYDRLEVAEITEWLAQNDEPFDLIISCDTLIYFGDLRQAISPAASHLKTNGVLAFTVECGDRYPFHLTDSGRYTHHPDHVREVARECGLSVERLEQAFLRKEYGAEVMGLFAVLKKAN